MRKFKRTMAMLLSLAMVGSVFAGCDKDDDSSTTADPNTADTSSSVPDETDVVEVAEDTGDTLVIYCWNDEFQQRFEKYFQEKGLVPDGIEVKFVINPNEGGVYQTKLDTALLGQSKADEKIDMFLIEADYALKYVNTDFALDVKSIGLTDEDLAEQYQYTKDIVTDASGAQKAVAWQACGGLFLYRRSIALDVLGTEDPTEVQAQISDLDKFDAVAEQMAAKGYKMLSGYDDIYRPFSNNISAPLVNENNEIVIDPMLDKWVEMTKEYTDKGYNNRSSLWDDTFAADQAVESKVFGFFWPAWGINFCLSGYTGEAGIGDWAACEGPLPYFWGGTWICACQGTDNPNLVADVMRTITCDSETMKQISYDTIDFTNNQTAMDEMSADTEFGFELLGGQNPMPKFAAASANVDMSNVSPYDQAITEEFQNGMHEYFEGNMSYDEALDFFYENVTTRCPALKRAD